MKNKDKIILDLCGGTGSWSEPYRNAGYDVRLITLPEWDVRQWQSGSNQWHEIRELIRTGKIYGIIAAPPCTMFSRARTTASTPRDFDGAMEIVQSCLGIIWEARKSGSLKFWALENPMGILRQFLGNPGWSFRGWEFGDNHMKFTDIWGYFDMPVKKRGAKKPNAFDRRKWANPKKPAKYADMKLDRAGIRAITPSGFARAFYKANR